jgi:hypothetical protein
MQKCIQIWWGSPTKGENGIPVWNVFHFTHDTTCYIDSVLIQYLLLVWKLIRESLQYILHLCWDYTISPTFLTCVGAHWAANTWTLTIPILIEASRTAGTLLLFLPCKRSSWTMHWNTHKTSIIDSYMSVWERKIFALTFTDLSMWKETFKLSNHWVKNTVNL